MKKTQEHQIGVRGVLAGVRRLKNDLGNYRGHFITGNQFIVKLTNGEIIIPKEAAENYETSPGGYTNKDLTDALLTFRAAA